MRFGIEVVPFGEWADPRRVARLASAAEEAGWEALCVWDHLVMPYGTGDPWVILSAVAAATQRMRLLPSVAALPRYQPHILARLLTSLDHLSQGRLILAAGLGAINEEFTLFGGAGEPRMRAEMLDEGLEVITRLWSGEAVEHHERHYTVAGAALQPTPVQQPRIPIWIGGASAPALRRAARWEGWIIGVIDENGAFVRPPEQLAADAATIRSYRPQDGNFEIAIDGLSQPGEAEMARAYAAAGATWWFEAIYGLRGSEEELIERVKAGPPAW